MESQSERNQRPIQYNFHNNSQIEQDEFRIDNTGKINLQFITNLFAIKQRYKGILLFSKKLNVKAYLRAVVVEPPGPGTPLENL